MIEGLAETKSVDVAVLSINNASHNTRRGMRQGWFAVGALLKKRANEQILKKPKSGKLYKYKGRKHRASAAGESPANRSGTYRKSIGYKIKGYSQLEFGARAPYAGYLEKGTVKMKPRPALKNAIDFETGRIQSVLSNELKKALK